MDVILDLFVITGVVVGFGEGVCDEAKRISQSDVKRRKHVMVRV